MMIRTYLSTALLLTVVTGNLLAADNKPVSLGSVNQTAVATELKTVKIYGTGGVAGLETYQSGFFISGDGHILTVWSTVLDLDTVIAVTSDGKRMEARVVGIDPNLEIAVLATGKPTTNFFDVLPPKPAAVQEKAGQEKVAQEQAAPLPIAQTGDRVLAFSNLFGIATGNEMSSLQKGVIMATTQLDARRGTFESVYQGPIYVIDAMTNNPGAAGGALTDMHGRLLGILGKELRDARANTWLNYAIPIAQVNGSASRLIDGKSILKSADSRKAADRPMSLVDLGIALIPDVLAKTPAYIDLVQPNSPASAAKLAADDLVLFVNSVRITSQTALRNELKYIDQADEVTLLIQRGTTLREVILHRQ